MRIRSAKIEELSGLSDLCLRSKGLWGYDRAFLESCRDPLTIRQDDWQRDHVMVVELEGQIAGVLQFCVDGDEAEIEKLFVEPAFGGKGVGHALMYWTFEKAKALGVKRITIASDPFAMPFYQKYGAHQVGEIVSEVDPERFLPRLAIDL